MRVCAENTKSLLLFEESIANPLEGIIFLFAYHCYVYSRVSNRRVGWNKGVGGKIAGNLINKLDGIKELVGNCTKAKNELVRKFSNFITLKIENHFNSTSIIEN